MKDEEMTSSLTKGCFLFKPSSKNKSPRKKARRDSTSSHACPVDYYSSIKQESKQDRSTRFLRYEECWNDLHAQIMEVQHNLNEKIFDDLLHFVISAHDGKKSSFPIEIPTAALITGVNLPDHEVIFSSFVEKMKSSITLYAVRLFSKNCPDLKSMLKNALDGLLESVEQEAEHYDEEVTLNMSRTKSVKVFKDYSFKELRDWYKQTCLNASMITAMEEMDIETNNDSLSNMDGKVDGPPLVFVLEDFERFPPGVLQDFILIASEYVKELPILFVFGVATTVSAVHRFLPHAVSSRLSIEKFQSQPSLECLTEVIDKVLLSNEHAFKLGPMMFRLLYEHFLYHDFSINNFVRALKYAVLDHFYENAFSILCTKNFEEIEDYIRSLSDAKLKRLQELESFQKYLDRKSEKEQKKLKTDNTWLKETIIQLFMRLQNQEKLFFPVVKCFHAATANLPGHPYGKRLRDTYEIITVTNKNTYSNYKSAINLLRFLSRDELKAILSKCAETLNTAIYHDSDCKVFKEHVEEIKNYVCKIEDLARGTGLPDNSSIQSPALTPKAPVAPAVFKSRYDFTEKLKSAVKEKRKESPYEILRNQIVETLDKFFKKHLISPLSMPFHEIFYYDDMHHVKQRINGTPRAAIQTALSNPHSYLQCECCVETHDKIQDSQPDISILYKLHLECGRLINLYDWLQAFITVIDPSLTDTKKKKSKLREKQEEQLQARFIRGVAELQYLGFIKSTRRKTDHVARLTWGGC